MMLRMRDIMKTPPILIDARCPLGDALATMDAACVRHLPVVDARDEVIGIVSRSDVEVALGLERAVRGERSDWRVADIMHHPVRTIPLDSAVFEAAAILAEEKIGALPVVDAANRVAGIVTAWDFVDVARRLLVGLDAVPHAEPESVTTH